MRMIHGIQWSYLTTAIIDYRHRLKRYECITQRQEEILACMIISRTRSNEEGMQGGGPKAEENAAR